MTENNSLTALFTAYFYQYGHLSLPGLGNFQIEEEVELPLDEPKKHLNNIRFNKNPREDVDPALIKFITERTRKMSALAVADLNTFAEQAREMLNIGQPVSFEGIGTLKQTLQGGYAFTPGIYQANLLPGFEENDEALAYPDRPSSLSEVRQPSAMRNRSFGGTLIIFLCLVIVGVLIYFMVIYKSNRSESSSSGEEVTLNPPAPVSDSQTMKPELPPGVIHYEVVFEHLNRDRAFHRYNQLTGWGHKVIMRTRDSVHFTLSIPFTTPAVDTAAMKDSIRILYGHPTSIRYLK
jgi:hypothetical protein